jgi:Flp pilus assembly protein TadB
VNLWAIAAGVLVGLGVFWLVRELIPGSARLDAALRRLDPASGWLGAPVAVADYRPAVPALPAGPAAAPPAASTAQRIGERLAALAPWLPVPAADLALLGRDRATWLASKLAWGIAGLALVPVASVALLLDRISISFELPAFASILLGLGLFFVPDLSVRSTARRMRTDFRHALASYLDLVALERGAGAGPTQALEAAAEIGTGWAFQRIRAALDAARRTGRAPWTGLAELAAQTGVTELADLADIAEVAGQEGARILQTLAARAESMRAEALAAERASAGSKSTTMVVPIALLAAGFLILIVFPMIYRILGSG